VVDEDVAGTVVLQVGDLQAMRVADLGWLEGGVQMLDLHDSLGLLGLEARPLAPGGPVGAGCAVWLWVSYSPALVLGFLSCKSEVTALPSPGTRKGAV